MLKSRAMTQADVPMIASIEAEATTFPWRARLFEDCIRAGHHCQIYFTDDNPIIAYTIVQQILDEAHLLNICVASRHQNQGYGSFILESVIKYAKINNSVTVLLEVRASNHGAQQLYQRVGFNEMTIRHHYYPAEKGREDAILMALMLFGN